MKAMRLTISDVEQLRVLLRFDERKRSRIIWGIYTNREHNIPFM